MKAAEKAAFFFTRNNCKKINILKNNVGFYAKKCSFYYFENLHFYEKI